MRIVPASRPPVRRANRTLHTLFAALLGIFAAASAAAQAPDPSAAALDEAYRLMREGNAPAAIAALRRAVGAEPAAVRPRLELAYALLRADSTAAAAEQLERVVALEPQRAEVHTQLAYLHLAAHPERARAHFEQAARLDPSNAQLQLDLAYLHARLGDDARARRQFELVAAGTDAAARARAEAELAARRGVVRRGSWLTEALLMPLLQTEHGNVVGHLQLRSGPVLDAGSQAQLYASVRATRDSRSFDRQLPQIFSDNALVAAVGVRLRPAGGPVALYAEAGPAFALGPAAETTPAVRTDIRAGVVAHRDWSAAAAQGRAGRATMEAYGDVGYYSRFDDNVIGYLQLRPGLVLARAGAAELAGFALGSTVLDTRRAFYNNRGEAGLGLSLRHRGAAQATLRAEYLLGRYLVDRPDAAREYRDLRLTLMIGRTFVTQTTGRKP